MPHVCIRLIQFGDVQVAMATHCTTHSRQYATDSDAQGTLIEMAAIIGHKWYPVILHQLCIEDTRGFSDLHDAIDPPDHDSLRERIIAVHEYQGVYRFVGETTEVTTKMVYKILTSVDRTLINHVNETTEHSTHTTSTREQFLEYFDRVRNDS